MHDTLTDSQRAELKKPLGDLILDADVTARQIIQHSGSVKSYITIGDATTRRALELKLPVCMEIVDGIEKRLPCQIPDVHKVSKIIKCKNPPGCITDDAINAIRIAIHSIPGQKIRILVDGEEDLLVLPVCNIVYDNLAILYGQPNEGMVVVRIDSKSRNKAKSLLKSIFKRV